MEISFKHTRCEPDPKITEAAIAKLRKLDRLLPNPEAALASLELERAVGNQQKGDIWRAELTIRHHGALYRAESTKAKLDHAVTTVLRDVTDELARAHRKANHEKRKGSGVIKDLLRGFRR